MPHETTSLWRHSVDVRDVAELRDALEATGGGFAWLMGELAWHDGYWEPQPDALPGVFVEPYAASVFDRPGMAHLAEAFAAGPDAQVQIAATGDAFRLVLMYEDGALDRVGSPWGPGERLEPVHAEDYPTLVIQDTNRFGYADKRGSFKSPVFAALQAKRVAVRTYYDNHRLVAWRFVLDAEQA